MTQSVVSDFKSVNLNKHSSVFFSPSDCSWSEQDYRLAWWAWKKWRYHRMTSLRVG